jgi:hypothetical protein
MQSTSARFGKLQVMLQGSQCFSFSSSREVPGATAAACVSCWCLCCVGLEHLEGFVCAVFPKTFSRLVACNPSLHNGQDKPALLSWRKPAFCVSLHTSSNAKKVYKYGNHAGEAVYACRNAMQLL